jgi:uncharacterized protein (DUF58 family)
MITGKGIGFVIVAVLVFLLARLTQVGWFYLIDAALWGIVLFSAALPSLGVAFLDARRRVEHGGAAEGRNGPAEGEPVQIELSLQNRAFWPRFFLSVSYECSLADPERRWPRFFIGKLAGSNQFSMSSQVAAYQRGLHCLGRVIVESSAPFGLFRQRVRLDESQPVLVYPQVYPLQRMALVDGLAGAVMQRQKSRVGMEIAGSRPYFPGDPRRHIHWRNTAQAGRPMVKEFEDPRDQTLYLVFDATGVWGEGKETTLEYAIKVVASVADYARRRRIAVRIWGGNLQGDTTGPSHYSTQAESPWPEVLRGLALAAPGDGLSLAESLDQLPPGSSALVVVSAGDGPGLRAVGQAAARLHRLAVVALEGFGEPESGNDLLDALELARVPVVRCGPGQLVETLRGLEKVGEALTPGPSPTGRGVTATESKYGRGMG